MARPGGVKGAGLGEARNHSEKCRTRIIEAMGETEEGRRACERDDTGLKRGIELVHEAMADMKNSANAESQESQDAEEVREDAELLDVMQRPRASLECETGITRAIATLSVDVAEGHSSPRGIAGGK